MMTPDQRLIDTKVGLLELAKRAVSLPRARLRDALDLGRHPVLRGRLGRVRFVTLL